jgi:hypothetical protein
MSRLRIAGIVAAFALAGCSEETGGVSEGTVPFKSGNVEQLGPLKEQMTQNIKSKAYTKRSTGEDKSKESKSSGESKPSTEGKAEEKKP